MSKCVRVLQINSGSVNFGGVSALLYNLYMHIDTEHVQFDFLTPEKTTYTIHKKEIEERGGKVQELNIKGNPLIKKIRIYKGLKAYLKQHPYQIVHINSGNFFFNLCAGAAVKSAGVPVRILHSHTAGSIHNDAVRKILFRILRSACERNATHLMACSQLAAEYMFTQKTVQSGKVMIVPNGIDAKQFAYNAETRSRVRRTLQIEDNFVIGCVARFMPEKNHDFLLDVFASALQQIPNAVLMLVGQGELEDAVKQKAEQLGIQDKILFLGQRSDTAELYQAMDAFMLTSLHEGFGIVNIEAQTSGLWCIVADTIPQEANVTGRMKRLSFKAPLKDWTAALVSVMHTPREDMTEQVRQGGYDIHVVAKKLEQLYLDLAERN